MQQSFLSTVRVRTGFSKSAVWRRKQIPLSSNVMYFPFGFAGIICTREKNHLRQKKKPAITGEIIINAALALCNIYAFNAPKT